MDDVDDWSGPPLVCVRCRVPPRASRLDADLVCATCGAAHSWLTDAVPVVVAPEVEARIGGRDAPGPLPAEEAVGTWLDALEPGTAPFAQVARVASALASPGTDDGFHARLCDALVPRTAAHGRAVDLGCGAGSLSFALAGRGWDVTGIDLDAHALRWADRVGRAAGRAVLVPVRRDAGRLAARAVAAASPVGHGAARFMAANLLDPPFDAATFDLVALVNVLDVVPYPAVALQQATALLAPGGHLLVASPDAWVAPAVPRTRWLAVDDAGWRRVFAAAGLETVAAVDDLEWRIDDTPRMSHVYRVHARVLRRTSKG